jgi:hypothetical protein
VVGGDAVAMPAIVNGVVAQRGRRPSAGPLLDPATAKAPRATRRPSARVPTLSDDLERAQLQFRARQLERVLRILARRGQTGTADGGEATGLRRAIDGFALELEQVRARLFTGDGDRAFAAGQRAGRRAVGVDRDGGWW